MAGKKAKPRKTARKPDFTKLKPSDVICPICRTILIEPVSLQCNHAFCKQCFEGTMENANLVCPLCRVRVGSWFRKTKKDGKLVDEELWKAVQEQYPKEVQNRYQGIDNGIEAVDVPIIVVASQGEIRKEYEQERQKELEEQRKIKEAEEKASAPLIQRLKDEEEQRKRLEEEKLRIDEALAKKLAEDLEIPSTSKFTPKRPLKPESAKKSGPMDKFVKSNESKPIRLCFKSEEKKAPYKIERKKFSISPIPNFAKKEYTCHVINAESHLKTGVSSSFSIFNKPKPSCSASGMQAVQKKSYPSRKLVETAEGTKSVSGYKSSGSGSEDAIDQECKFYFKPIDTQRRHHLPGTVPVKIPSRRGKQVENACIGPPAGKIINLQLQTFISAFARFSMSPLRQQNATLQESSSRDVIEDELSETLTNKPKKLKRKLFDELSPVRKKRGKKNMEVVYDETISSPFLGFDNVPSREVNRSPFYGFDVLDIKMSDRKRDTVKKLLREQRHDVIDNKYVVSTEQFHRKFKTYSRHKKLIEEPLKLQITRKTSKNGLNMSEAIKNKLAELQSFVEEPDKDWGIKLDIDINRNVPKDAINNSFSNFKAKAAATTKISPRKVHESLKKNHVDVYKNNYYDKKRNDNLGESQVNNFDSSYLKHEKFNINIPRKEKNVSVNSRLENSKNKASIDTFNSVAHSAQLGYTSPVHTGLNGTWRTKQKKGSPRKRNLDANNLDFGVLSRVSPIDTDPDSGSRAISKKTTKLEEFLTKTYPNKTKSVPSTTDTSSKITDTFSKTKNSPTKPKSTDKKSKPSPSTKTKFNNNVGSELALSNGELLSSAERRRQERLDFELAKKLQEQFNSIQTPSTTRRGTKRQVTLDEMLSV